jgi:hypothetical protein
VKNGFQGLSAGLVFVLNRFIRFGVATAFGLGLSAPFCAGALWQNQSWALVGSATEDAGYDSNLTASEQGEGAVFFTETPRFVLKRFASLSKFEVTGDASLTHFIGRSLGPQYDGSASVVYAYPLSDDRLPRFVGNAGWRHTTAGNRYVGERLVTTAINADVGGRLLWTGKLGLNASALYTRDSYNDRALNTDQYGAIRFGLGYQPQPTTEYSLVLISGTGESLPHGTEGAWVKKWDESLVVEAQGELLPKVTGKVFGGISMVRYRGAYSRRDWLPTSGGSLDWQITPRGVLSAGVELGAGFSPGGDSEVSRELTVSYRQALYSAWYWESHLTPNEMSYLRERRVRLDRAVTAGTGISYEPSPRVSAGLAYELTHATSDASFGSFNRHLISVSFTYHL